jgi:hypothetical protein
MNLLLVFECLTGKALEHLEFMIQLKKRGHHSLRTDSVLLLEVPHAALAEM